MDQKRNRNGKKKIPPIDRGGEKDLAAAKIRSFSEKGRNGKKESQEEKLGFR